MLPAQASKPLRVCDCCYASLSMGKGEVDVSAGDSGEQPDLGHQSPKDLRDADTTDDSEDEEENEAEQPVAEIKEEKVR